MEVLTLPFTLRVTCRTSSVFKGFIPSPFFSVFILAVDTLSLSLSPTKSRCFRKWINNLISQYNWTNLYNCLDIESTTELFYSVLNSIFCECVPDSFPLTLDRPPWSTNQLQRLRNLKTNFYKKYKKSGTNFNVLNSHCYSMYLNRCKFEFSKDPREFYNFVNAKRKSSALPSSVRLNSIEASTDPEIHPEDFIEALMFLRLISGISVRSLMKGFPKCLSLHKAGQKQKRCSTVSSTSSSLLLVEK